MNKIIKRAFKLMGTRLLFVILSVFFIMPFSWLLEFNNGFLYYSILSSLFYLSYVYSDMHTEGGKDNRQKLARPHNGFLSGALSEIPTIIFVIVLLILEGAGNFRNANIVFIAWAAPFVGFLGLPTGAVIEMTKITPYYYWILAPVPIISGLGYLAGTHKFFLLANYRCKKALQKSKGKSNDSR